MTRRRAVLLFLVWRVVGPGAGPGAGEGEAEVEGEKDGRTRLLLLSYSRWP